MTSYVTFVQEDVQTSGEYAYGTIDSSKEDTYYGYQSSPVAPSAGGGFGIWVIAVVLLFTIIWIIRKDRKKQKSLLSTGTKGLSPKLQSDIYSPTNVNHEANIKTQTTSFYVTDDGTIVRGHKNDSGFEQKSIIQSPTEQQDALSLIKESAQAGYAEAQYFLGLCYEQGTVVPKNLEIAKKWYEQASSQGFPQAKYRLGRLLMSKGM